MKEEDDPEQQFLQQQLPLLSEDVLDIDIQEALNEIHQFLQRHRQAHQTYIDLLIQSQCQFGSIDAAKAFENIHEKLHLVKKRKLLLNDARELEVSGGIIPTVTRGSFHESQNNERRTDF